MDLPLRTYLIETYGCQMNERDTETMAGILESLGYVPVEKEEDASIILLNTCSVRESAENKIWAKMGELKKIKQKNPDVILGICGCMPQQEVTIQKIKQSYPHMDLVFGTHNLHQLPELLAKAQTARKMVVEVLHNNPGVIIENLPSRRADNLKAFVTIMYGCNNFCTYCIVPYTRGRERSRMPEDIIREVEDLAAKGYKEITLLGQNVNSYGKDLEVEIDFAGLLQQLNRVNGIERIRFTTSHPKDLSDRLIEAIASLEKVCEHIHLPVQSGSTAILKKMNRHYSKEDYLRLVEKLKNAVPDIAITTDIIVGFPGETEADFAETMDLVEKVRFSAAYTFIYNKRSGTPAAEYNDQVPEDVKSQRIQHLIDRQNQITLEENLKDIGKTLEVLVEGPSKTNPEFFSGRTRTNKIVVFRGNSDLIGRLIPVRIANAKTWHLEGEII